MFRGTTAVADSRAQFFESDMKFLEAHAHAPFWAGERRISPGVNDLCPLNSPEPICHNNQILKSLNICL